MTGWLAIVPRKPCGESKSRLATHLDGSARSALVDEMAAHVLSVLAGVPRVRSTVILGPPMPEGGDWSLLPDRGRGLNAELAAARRTWFSRPLLVIHADLPLLAQADVESLLDAAECSGIALAADRHGLGTNAVALMPRIPFRFRFGDDSLRIHRDQHSPRPAIVDAAGLALDVDEPADLELAAARGAASCRAAMRRWRHPAD